MKYAPYYRPVLGQQYNWPQAPIPGIIPEEWGLQPIDGAPPPASPPPSPSPLPGGQAPGGSPFPGAVTVPGYIPLPSGGYLPAGGMQPSVAPGYRVTTSGYLTTVEVEQMVADEIEETPSMPLKVANWGLLALLVGVGVGAATS